MVTQLSIFHFLRKKFLVWNSLETVFFFIMNKHECKSIPYTFRIIVKKNSPPSPLTHFLRFHLDKDSLSLVYMSQKFMLRTYP